MARQRSKRIGNHDVDQPATGRQEQQLIGGFLAKSFLNVWPVGKIRACLRGSPAGCSFIVEEWIGTGKPSLFGLRSVLYRDSCSARMACSLLGDRSVPFTVGVVLGFRQAFKREEKQDDEKESLVGRVSGTSRLGCLGRGLC